MAKAKTPVSHILFRKHLKELGLCWHEEHRFHPERKWLWDFALLTEFNRGLGQRIAIEIQGQIWRKGGHTSGFGMQRDMDKRNAGVMLGWRVLTFSTRDVLTGRAKDFLKEHLGHD